VKKLKRSHNVSEIFFHIILSTKYRREVLNSPSIEESLIFNSNEIARRKKVEIIEIGVDNDHIHLMLQFPPTLACSNFIRIYKSETTKTMLLFPAIKNVLMKRKFWSAGYFVKTIGGSQSADSIRQYVRTQRAKSSYKSLEEKK